MFNRKYNEERDGERGILFMAKMGRPKVEDPRKKSIGVRLTNGEYKTIKEYAASRNLTITETVLLGIRNLIGEPAK